ncbi:MAG: heme ABC exporter ATP-binding protein CcmA [Paracoccaceae bacterium]
MALTVEGLAVERGGRLALVAPDFRVERGQAALIAGPNGAGKSTLLRAVAGLVRPLRGRVMLDGAGETGQHAAYAGHLDAVKPALSVRANLASWAALYGASEGVDAALESFGLSHIAASPAAYCSAGQKRRLGLARLLVTGRRVWLLDEPTVSLDAGASADFARIVAAHCAGGGIAVAATHVEMGLPAGPRIDLLPPAAPAADAVDPFLTGAWA